MNPNKQEVLACLHAFLKAKGWTEINRKKATVYKKSFEREGWLDQKITIPNVGIVIGETRLEEQLWDAIATLAMLYDSTYTRFYNELVKKGANK
jgi:hypothetical protein